MNLSIQKPYEWIDGLNGLYPSTVNLIIYILYFP